jgi:hypothetical protein
MVQQQRGWGRGWAVPCLAGVLLAGLLATPARAGAEKPANSLGMIPADAGFYSAMLRNKEQIDIIAKSKAWAEIWNMPAVQMGWKMLQDQYESGNLTPVKAFFSQPENRELLDLLADAGSHEIFIFGGGSWRQFLELAGLLQNAMNFGPLAALIDKGDFEGDPKAPMRMMLRAAAAHPELIVVPDLILGFKLTDTKKVAPQLKRLEELANNVVDQVPPLKGRVKMVKVGDDSFLTFGVDGSLVPWEEIPFKEMEEKEGEFDGLIRKLKGSTMSLSIGVRNDYLMVAFGANPEVVAQLGGNARRLTDQAELKPLLAAADKPLTALSYTSAALRAGGLVSQRDIDSLLQMARQVLAKADIPEEKKKQIGKDIEGLAGEMAKNPPQIGPEVAFTYMTAHGYESFDYDYTKEPALDGSKALTLLSHLGGNPIGAAVTRQKSSVEDYHAAVKWLKTIYNHGEEIFLEKLKKDEREIYQKITKEVFPLLRRLDEITGKMLLPALADGQIGLVLDAKWRSKQWQKQVPATPVALPLPEVALLLGVSDADLLAKALHSYRELFNDALARAKELAPPGASIPEIQIPAPEKSEAEGARLYTYFPPADWGLDSQIRLTVGLSDKVFVVALSNSMVERIVRNQPPRVEGKPLADPNKPLAVAGFFNWPALIDAVTPWIELALANAPLPDGADAPPGTSREDIRKQVNTVLRVLKCLRGASSATYFEGDVLVTHGETIIHDLDAGKP